MRQAVAAAAVVLTFLLAGCGGSESATKASATGTASGAGVAPSDALAFISINTDRDSGQWEQGDALLKKFPGRERLLGALNDSDSDVNLRRDVLPLLGKEVGIVVLRDAAGKSPHVVGLTQPTDEDDFAAVLQKGERPAVHERVGDWTAFAETRADLDAFTSASDSKLADDARFADAMSELPDEANAKVFVNGDGALDAVRAAIPQMTQLPTGNVEWFSAALTSQDDGWKVEGASKSAQTPKAEPFAPTLLSKVPAGALAVASFKGVDHALKQLESSPGLSGITQLQAVLGIRLADVEQLLSGEGVLFVQKSAPFPEVTLVVHQSDPAKARSVVDQLATRASALLGGRVTQQGNLTKFSLGSVAVYLGVDGDDLVVSDASAAFGRTVADSIEDDSSFSAAKNALGLPDETAGFVYLNVNESAPLLEGYAQAEGDDVPPAVSENVEPLQSFIAYTTASDDVQKFTGLLLLR